MVPSSNVVMEIDLARELQDAATVHTARMYLGDPVTVEGITRMLDQHAVSAARDLGTLEPDLVVFGCTSAGAVRGRDADAELRMRLEQIVAAPVLGVMQAITDALHSRGVRRISLIAPYVADRTQVLRDGLSESGFEVVTALAMGLVSNHSVSDVAPDQIVTFVRESQFDSSTEALVIACTNFRALEASTAIRSFIPVPVITANSAVVESVVATKEGSQSNVSTHA
jgi:maleate isomerase